MHDHLLVAISSAIKAGAAILEIYQNESFDVSYKDDGSPLTEADKASNSIINSALATVDIPIISEENDQIPFEHRKEWEYCWIVDPLDGTKEFVKRNGEFTVNIALCNTGKPVLGVIYVPVTKELYYADSEKGEAYKTIVNNDRSSMQFFKAQDRIYNSESDPDHIRVVGSRSHMNLATSHFLSRLKKEYKEVTFIRKGSALKFCLVAEGKADVYPRFAPTMEWDTAAGQALCNAVGLEVIDQQTQKPMVYNRRDLSNSYFIVQ